MKKPLEQTHLVIAFEGRGIVAPDHDAAHVFTAATGGGMSSRLFQEVREKRGLAYAIHAFHWGYQETGLFGFYAGIESRKAGELTAAALDCLSQAAEIAERNRSRARQGADEGRDPHRARSRPRPAFTNSRGKPSPMEDR